LRTENSSIPKIWKKSEHGTLYFSSNRNGGLGGFDIYRSHLSDEQYGEGDLFIALDESYIIFSSGRPGGFGRSDLYISFRLKDVAWSIPQNMGAEINSDEIEYSPFISSDGKFLFFTSYRNPDKYSGLSIEKYSEYS